jgi:NAD-dependent dihydropyrimidine dehydrogenase PreA subunit
MVIEWRDPELCQGCGTCVQICPTDVFRMDRENKRALIKYPEDCQLCELCMLECPAKALTVTPEKRSPLLTSWG